MSASPLALENSKKIEKQTNVVCLTGQVIKVFYSQKLTFIIKKHNIAYISFTILQI